MLRARVKYGLKSTGGINIIRIRVKCRVKLTEGINCVWRERVRTNTPPRTTYTHEVSKERNKTKNAITNPHCNEKRKVKSHEVFKVFTSLGTTATKAGAGKGLVKASATFSAEGRR